MPATNAILPQVGGKDGLGKSGTPWKEVHTESLSADALGKNLDVNNKSLSNVAGLTGSAVLNTPVLEADRWIRSPRNPIIKPTAGWEGEGLIETCVIYDAGTFHAVYRGHWTDTKIGYATSTDGLTWAKYVSNPIIAAGVNGVPGGINPQQPQMIKVGATWYVFFSSHIHTGSIHVMSGNSPTTLSYAGVVLGPQGAVSGWNNSSLFLEGSTWHLMVEGRMPADSVWRIFHATCATLTGTYILQNSGNPLNTLEVAAGGMYGGPYIYPSKINNIYHMWYHASPNSGDLPTNIYHATSTDFNTWTKTPATPVLTYLGVGYEYDQVADPHVIEVNGVTYMYYDADNNSGGAGTGGVTSLAQFFGPLQKLVDGTPLLLTDASPKNLGVLHEQNIPLNPKFSGIADATGGIRATGNVDPTTGKGLEMLFTTLDEGRLQAYDRDTDTWETLQIAGSSIRFDVSSVPKMTLYSNGNLSAGGTIRSTGIADSDIGAGTEILYTGTVGRVQVYDRDLDEWKPIEIGGKTIRFDVNGVPKVTIYENGHFSAGGTIRATATADSIIGEGIELRYAGGIGEIRSYNSETTTYNPLRISGSSINLRLGSTVIPTGVAIITDGDISSTLGAAIADISSPDATDLPTAITLVNEIKSKLNTLLARSRSAKIIAP